MEEWNEYGELEDQIEDQVDIFGDVPISATSAEAQATAAARLEAQRSSSSSQGRTASETRHISISEPVGEARRKGEERAESLADAKKDTHSPLSMAMRQAGMEAAAKVKAGQKKSEEASGGGSGAEKSKAAATGTSTSEDPTDSSTSTPSTAALPKLDADAEEVAKVETDAKTPEVLASQGQKKTSTDKLGGSPEDEGMSLSHTRMLRRLVGRHWRIY